MKKICKYLLLLIPFMFMFSSCVNLIEENVNTQISYTVGEEAARSISKSLEGNSVIDNSTELKVTSVLLNKDNKQVTSASVNTTLGNLARVKLHLSKIPFGNDYTLKMGILYKDCLIYEGESTGISITSGNPNVSAQPLALREVKSSITYILNGGKLPNGIPVRNEYFVKDNIEISKLLPTQTNKTFDGWYTTPSFSGKKVETLGSTNFLGNVILYAKWISETCTITYDTGREDLVKPRTIKVGDYLKPQDLPTVTDVPELKRDGSAFKGWYLFDAKINSGYTVTTDITLTARWESYGQVSSVTFSPAKSSEADVYIDYNDTIYLSTDTYGATITYTTDGSDPKISTNKHDYSKDKPIVFTQDNPEQPLHIMAYAHNGIDKDSEVTKTTYKLKTYKVSFDTKDPAITSPTIVSNLKRGDKLTKEQLKAISKEGDEFIAWLYNGSIVKEGYVVTEDMVLTPLWRKANAVSDVTFSIPEGYVDYNAKVSLSTATEGATIYYTLDGSDPKISGTKYDTPFTFTPSSDTTHISCYATKDGLLPSNVTSSSYTLKSYLVSFDSLNKGNEPKTQVVKSGTPLDKALLEPLTEPGYDFIYWSINGTKVNPDTEVIITEDTLIKAEWEPCIYNITYVSEGEIKNTNPQTVTINDSFTLSEPTRKGYDFIGWYLEDNYKTLKTDITKQTSDLTLYAQWAIINYTITYDLNNGIFPSSESVINSYTVTSSEIKLPTPTRENYTFDGWFTDNSLATGKNESIPTGSSGNKVFYAKWTEKGKTADVTFEGPIGNEVEKNGTNVILNCSTPNARIYYTTNGDNPTTSSTQISSGTTITINSKTTIKAFAVADGLKQSNTTNAEYVLKKYTVNFQTEYGTVPSQNLEEGAKVTVPTGLTRTGYTLTGWIKTKGTTSENDVLWDFSKDTVSASDITLVAKWTPNTYKVIYNHNSIESGTTVEETYSYNQQFVIPSNNLTKDGYILTWCTEQTPSDKSKSYNIGDFVQNITTSESITLYAQLTPITYTIKYDLDGGMTTSQDSIALQKEVQVTYSDTETLVLMNYGRYYTKQDAKPLNQWITDDGVIYNSGDSVSKNLTNINGDTVTLTALWSNVTYTVIYNGNGSTKGSTPSQRFSYNTQTTLSPNGFEKKGYIFTGWNTKSTGDGVSFKNEESKVFNLSETNLSVVELFAQWTPITYEIYYNGNGSTSGSTASQTFTYDNNSTLNLNGFEKTGYIFNGWNTKSGGDGISFRDEESKIFNLTDTNSATVELFAQWTPITYKVSFNLNGGKSTINEINCTYDTPFILPTYTDDKSGFSSKNKWNIEQNGSGTNYTPGQNCTSNLTTVDKSTVILYAQWTDIAPNPVSNVQISQNYGVFTLSWNAPTPIHEDFDCVEISFGNNKKVSVQKGTNSTTIDGSNYELVNEADVTFSLIAKDKGGNSSKAVVTKAVKFNPYNLTLAPVLSSRTKVSYLANNPTMIDFGDWPQTIKADNVNVDESVVVKINGWNCHKGSDGAYYVRTNGKPKAKPGTTDYSKYVFSNGKPIEQDAKYFFKLEPISWAILNDNFNGKKLLISDVIHYATDFGNDNSYSSSNARAFLVGTGSYASFNGDVNTGSKPSLYKNGFSETAKKFLLSTNLSDAGVTDSIFLLAKNTAELQNSSLGFITDETDTKCTPRDGLASDFALCMGCNKNGTSQYWTRTAVSGNTTEVHYVTFTGKLGYYKWDVTTIKEGGIRPGICIKWP